MLSERKKAGEQKKKKVAKDIQPVSNINNKTTQKKTAAEKTNENYGSQRDGGKYKKNAHSNV